LQKTEEFQVVTKQRLTIEALQRVARISEAQVSPDGRFVAFVAALPELEKNRVAYNIWLLERQTGQARQLTFSEGKNVRPRWSPDSASIAFLSDRSGQMQIWLIGISGGESRQITRLPTEVESFLWSPAGNCFAVVSLLYPDCPDAAANEKRKKEQEDNPVKMKAITDVPFRRWDEWIDDRRSHILIVGIDGVWQRDLTPGIQDCPAWSESGPDGYAFSPDGQEVCFTRVVGNEALDGRKNLFTVSVSGGEPLQITHNRALDNAPRYSPDGRYIAYLATTRPHLDGDHAHLSIHDRKTGEQIWLTTEIDNSVSDFVWSPDAKTIWFTVEENSEETIYELEVSRRKHSSRSHTTNVSDLGVAPDGRHLIFIRSSFSQPAEVYQAPTAGEIRFEQLSHLNDEWTAGIEWGESSLFQYKGWKDKTVESWLIKPPDFSANRLYPLLLLIHGGPHGAWGNNFHYRWNPQVFAAAGYVVISPNFHGSSSYGQEFTDQIRGDWGGAPYEDLMKGVDEAIRWPFIDSTRLAAAGASYGGYMANWIAGHTDRFRCIVSHDGLFNLVTSLYSSDYIGGTLEELGGTPWEKVEVLHQASPSTYACNFKTPMLIIHGQLDYRVDVSEGLAIFQVLKAKGVPAKFLYFPDENHWVLKPSNSVKWYKEILDWLSRWLERE
jgi:dipeptidyl aminopeptidase/acylaminoacyl peptidase